MKQKKLFPFVLKMVFLFILVLLVTKFASTIVYNIVNFSKYGIMMFLESVMALVMLVVMLLSGNKYVFTEKREQFGKAIKKGTPILIISFIALFSAIITIAFEQKTFNFNNFISLILLCAGIGIFEEFLSRGWLQNEFIERFGRNRKGIIKSIIISSLFFGLMHIANIFAGQGVFDTIMQVIQTTSAGLLLGAIYYRTKNIWACVFLHGFYDFSLMLGNINYIKDPITNGGTIISIFVSIFMSMIWIFGTLKLIQKSDIKEDEEIIFQNELAKENKNKKLCNIMIAVSILGFFLTTIIVPEKIETIEVDYKTKEVKEYTAHYPRYENFDVSYINSSLEQIELSIYLNDESKVAIKNKKIAQELILDYDVFAYLVIEDENSYGILIYTYEEIYYAEFSKLNMNNSLEYLENLKTNFKKYEVPELRDAGYITFDGSNEKYPYLLGVSYDKFVIMDNEIYLLK